MGMHSRRRTGVWKTPLAVILALALLAPVLTAKERRGAEVVIVKKDGNVVQGELLAVKGTDLLIMNTSTSAEVMESLANIQTIERVPKKSKWMTGMIIGAIAGAVTGLVVTPEHPDPTDDMYLTKGSAAVVGAVGYGLVGAAIGGMIKDKAIKVERTDPDYLAGIAAKLKTWAREPY